MTVSRGPDKYQNIKKPPGGGLRLVACILFAGGKSNQADNIQVFVSSAVFS